jgi:hypothetical protein
LATSSSLRPSLLRRSVRRGRAILQERRNPTFAAELEEFRSLVAREHPGLLEDFASAAKRTVLIVSLSNSTEQAKIEGLLTKALQAHGGRVRIFTFRTAFRGVNVFKALGLGRELLYYEDYAPSMAWLDEARALMQDCRTVQDFKQLQHRGARVGRQALGSVVRTRHDPIVDLDDPGFREEVANAIGYGMEGAHVAEGLLDAVQPDLLLMNERGYAGLGAFFDVALRRGIPAVQFGQAHRDDAYHVKRYVLETRELPPRGLDEATWQGLRPDGWTEERQRELDEELAARETGRWFMARRVRHGKQRGSPAALATDLGLDPEKKVVALFAHVLWDASMFYGQDLYPDQGTWFRETLRLAAEDDSVQWLVKLHPALLWKLQSNQVEEAPAELDIIRATLGELPRHMQLLMPDHDVDNRELFELLDAAVTIRGTIGIELPQLGVPVLTAGTSDYAGRGFTVDAHTVAEYEANVRSIGSLPRLTADQVERAKLYAYGVFCRKPWVFSSFRMDFMTEGFQSDRIQYRTHYQGLRSREELIGAHDLAAFASWALETDESDFEARAPASPPAVQV